MRRQTQRRLANLGRLFLLAASLGAAATGAVFAAKPDWVLRFENWSRRKLHGSDWALHNEACAAELAGDAARARVSMVELSDRLLDVRLLDRRVDLLNRCHEWLWSTDSASGDRAGRLRWARNMVAFNERNTTWVARLGAVLCEDPATRREGIDRLQRTWDQVPGHRDITPPLVQALLAAGETVRARNLLLASLDVPQSNWWTVLWQGVADAPPRRANLVPRVDGDGNLRAEFTLHESDLRGFAIEPPLFGAFVLEDATLSVQSGPFERTVPLAAAAPDLTMCRLAGTDLVLDGQTAPRITVVLPQMLAGPDYEVALRGRWRRAFPRALATLLLADGGERLLADDGGTSAAVRARLAELRLAALGTLEAEVFWGNGSGFAAERHMLLRLDGEPTGEEFRCSTAVSLPEPITELRLDLPDYRRLTLRDLRIELADAGGNRLAALDTGDVAAANGVTVDGGALVVVDVADPWIQLRVPAGLQPIRLLRIQAVVR
jgi:hypothetical protein